MSTSLFDRLGGTAGIDRIVDTAIAAHLANPVIQTRFANARDIDRARRMAKEFFAHGASGGALPYSGKDMVDAHKGMNINEQEYLAATDDILNALTQHGIAEDTRLEVLGILYSLKGMIIRV